MPTVAPAPQLPVLPLPQQPAVNRLHEYTRMPMGIDITVQELLTFTPNVLVMPDAAVRLQRNGINPQQIAKFTLTAIGRVTDANDHTSVEFTRTRERAKQQFNQGGKAVYGRNSWTLADARARGAQNDLTANNWQFRDVHAARNGFRISRAAAGPLRQFWHDVPLALVSQSVPRANFPMGQGRGVMTRCLEAVCDDLVIAARGYTTADWAQLIQDLQLVNTPAPQPLDPSKNLDEEFAENYTY